MTIHSIQGSGGKGSWFTGVVVIDRHVRPGDTLQVIFADTKTEDADLYRFLDDCMADLRRRTEAKGATFDFVRLVDGRDIWDVFEDKRYIGNSRLDPCSATLKRVPIRRYLDEHLDPADTVVYIGIDWTEAERFEKAKPYWAPFRVEAPLCEAPFFDKDDVDKALAEAGIVPARLYALGFAHNNCGGFCVKAGNGQMIQLLEQRPETYAYHEQREQQWQEKTGKPGVTVLRDRGRRNIQTRLGLTDEDVERTTDGWIIKATGEPLPKVLPISLKEFRERVQNRTITVDRDDIGGCACFTPTSYDADKDITA